ncbi:sialic acid-binding Ig-like lectin 14 [Hyperolius riggenbachi]|uniref:sialic acid-binding Ig-like lectin 14 n=1 Tax=Hyperolius riggenbachi TaxID=752182 RepID=UPI0035A3AA93
MRLGKGCNILVPAVLILFYKGSRKPRRLDEIPVRRGNDAQCQTAGYSIKVSRNVTVYPGLCVTIPCNFTANYTNTFSESRGIWYEKTGKQSDVAKDKKVDASKANFNITGNPNNGDCTLTITDAKKNDSGTYYFRFEGGKTVLYSYISEGSIKLHVTALSSQGGMCCLCCDREKLCTHPHSPCRLYLAQPEIKESGKLVAGQQVTLTCIPPGTCPGDPPNIQWRKSNLESIWRLSSSTVTFTLSLSDHQTNVTCEVAFKAIKISAQKTLNVLYPPQKIEVTMLSSGTGRQINAGEVVSITEEESLTLNCSADGNPAANVTWIKGNSKGSIWSVFKATHAAEDSYTCLAVNRYGSKEKQFTIKLQEAGTKTNQDGYSNRIIDVFIGMASGMAIVILVTLILRLTVKKKKELKIKCDNEEDPSPVADTPIDDPNQVYANIVKRGPLTKEDNTNKTEQQDTSGTLEDQENMHYSTINFLQTPSTSLSNEPEAEYAEVKVKSLDH